MLIRTLPELQHTLLYTFNILSVEPQWQQWTQQELDKNFQDSSDPLNWNYEKFPRLKRCRAVFVSLPSGRPLWRVEPKENAANIAID